VEREMWEIKYNEKRNVKALKRRKRENIEA
jgi:hypothetical protein